jgi:hypothetical protein
MFFSAGKSEDPALSYAPYIVLKDGEIYLLGIELEQEARNIARLLNSASRCTSVIPLKPTKPVPGTNRLRRRSA